MAEAKPPSLDEVRKRIDAIDGGPCCVWWSSARPWPHAVAAAKGRGGR